jgi:hypothetical protein
MTVFELIAKLQRYPADTLVMQRDWTGVALKAENVEDVRIRRMEYKGKVWGEYWVDGYVDRGLGISASENPETGVLIS